MGGGSPKVETHYKYLVAPELQEGNPYVKFDGTTFNVDPAHAIQQKYSGHLTLKRLIRTAAYYAGNEKIGVHRIAAKEPKVVDVEIAFTPGGDSNEGSTAPRVDIAVRIPDAPKRARLVFCEAKCADNDDLRERAKTRDGEERHIPVVTQIEKYESLSETPRTFLRSSTPMLTYVDYWSNCTNKHGVACSIQSWKASRPATLD
jgi:hypothetical protein